MIVWKGHVGDLRNAPYPAKDGTWKFPDVEAFRCYDKVSQFSLLSCENDARGRADNIDQLGVAFVHYHDALSVVIYLVQIHLRSKENTKCVNAIGEELTAAKHKLILLV
nr:beta-amylase 1, chloroplastic [Tanacetum cinerariifolium]